MSRGNCYSYCKFRSIWSVQAVVVFPSILESVAMSTLYYTLAQVVHLQREYAYPKTRNISAMMRDREFVKMDHL